MGRVLLITSLYGSSRFLSKLRYNDTATPSVLGPETGQAGPRDALREDIWAWGQISSRLVTKQDLQKETSVSPRGLDDLRVWAHEKVAKIHSGYPR